MINSAEISVVVQGPISKDNTATCLRSIRRVLPKSEIILSTWEGSDPSGLDYDILLLNEDPGAFTLLKDQSIKNNINRQILSTQNGIKKASRKYCLKYRTDLELKNDRFLAHFGTYQARNNQWKILKERVLTNYATHPLFRAFHPTDITCFGLTKDVQNIWDIPLASEENMHYYATHPYPEVYDSPFSSFPLARVGPEMYIWISFLKKYEPQFGTIDFRHNWDGRPENVHLTELTIANNLQILSREDFDFNSLNHRYLLGEEARFSWMDEKLWHYYYTKHCAQNAKWYDVQFHVYYPLQLLRYKLRYHPKFQRYKIWKQLRKYLKKTRLRA